MVPAVLEMLMQRLSAQDRKALVPAAKLSAELWNIARSGWTEESQEQYPPFEAKDFLPLTEADRILNERERVRAGRPMTPEEIAAHVASPEFQAFKKSLVETKAKG